MNSGALDKTALIDLFVAHQVLRFGDFTLKSGRRSPYFFNLGALNSGTALRQLGAAYAHRITQANLSPSVLFGPAYKGIPIASAAAIALANQELDIGVAYNRKEAKAHGEGGQLVGADVAGARVLLVDDVLTAGTALREAVTLVKAAGATVVGVVIALDRQELVEPGSNGQDTAVQALAAEMGNLPVLSLLNLQDVMTYLTRDDMRHSFDAGISASMAQYQAQYCDL